MKCYCEESNYQRIFEQLQLKSLKVKKTKKWWYDWQMSYYREMFPSWVFVCHSFTTEKVENIVHNIRQNIILSVVFSWF